ncbi:hypothetical protein ES703_107120 [subsurface metagenome]
MTIAFSASELINIAVGIERRGIAFYDTMVKSTENAEARDIFRYLADMERMHIHIFQSMLGEADEYQIPETYTGLMASPTLPNSSRVLRSCLRGSAASSLMNILMAVGEV